MNFTPDPKTETGKRWLDLIATARAEDAAKATTLPKHKPAHVTGKMNKTEAAFARRLDGLKAEGRIRGYWFEPMKVRLDNPESGRAVWYCIDFLIEDADGEWIFAEVKGAHIWEDGTLKWKWAADRFGAWGRWQMWQRKGRASEWVKLRDSRTEADAIEIGGNP